MFKEIRETYVYKYSSPFAAFLADGDEVCGWGNATDGPAYVSWIGGRHVLVHHFNGAVEHVHIPAHDGLQYLDRPAKGADVTGAYVWSWIEEAYPDVAAWELQPDEDELQDDEPGIIGHDGTAVDLSLGVPGCLHATPIPGSRFNGWVTSHNRALDDFAANHTRRNETAVLSLAAGILQFCSSHDAMGTGDDVDRYGAEHVLVPLLDGFDNALNFDLGRLDGGTLSGFSHAVRSAYAGGLGS